MPEAIRSARSGRALQFKPVTSGRPSDEIVAQIRAGIASQALQVGDKLPSEREMEQMFHVSRNSIRQAVKSLADMGLLEMRKGATGGAFVKGGGSNAVEAALSDLFHLGEIRPSSLTEVRVLVGTEVARLACMRATNEEIDALERNIEAAEAAARAGQTALRTELNLEFHRMLSRMTHNPLLVMLTSTVATVTKEFGRDMQPMSNRAVMPLRRHLLAHLRARDADAAAQAMREHLLRVEKHYLRHAVARNG